MTSFLDTGRTNGTTYYYKVTALNAIGDSSLSNEANATPIAPATAPSAPQYLLATAGNAQVSLTWSALPRTAALRSPATRCTARPAPGKRRRLRSPRPRCTSFLDTGRPNGTTYYYKVTGLER